MATTLLSMPSLPILSVLLGALLFGASTPVAKWLVGELSPLLLAGLLYLGSGVGLALCLAIRAVRARTRGARMSFGLPRRDLPALLGAILAGGVVAPALLILGLARTEAASASLLLNLEGVFTALLAWIVFREHADRRVVAGMAAIVLGGALLSWSSVQSPWSSGALLVAGACLCWGVDNNLTRRVSMNDAMLLACAKGCVAGAVNTTLALAVAHAEWPSRGVLAASLLTGFLAYGLSLTLFVLGLRALGAARTGAYFAVAPLFGVVVSLAIWPMMPAPIFWVAAALMALGLWLHVSERHVHPHTHEPLAHAHPHTHDEHHRHAHDFEWDGLEPHVHPHGHEALTHRHPHFPDIHHQHQHPSQNEDR